MASISSNSQKSSGAQVNERLKLDLPEGQAVTTELQLMGVLQVEPSADRLTRCALCSSEHLHSEDHLRIS